MDPTTPQLNAQTAANLVEQYNQAVKLAQQSATLREKELGLLEAQAKLEKQIKEEAENYTKIKEKTNELKQAEIDLETERIKFEAAAREEALGGQKASDGAFKQAKQNLETAKQNLKTEQDKVTTFEKQIKAIQGVGTALTKSFKDGEDAAKKLFGVTSSFFGDKGPEEIKEYVNGFIKQLGRLDTWAAGFNKAMSAASSALLEGFNIPLIGVRIDGLRKMITDVIEAPTEAFKQYGFLGQYTKDINSMRQTMLGLNVSIKDQYQAVGELSQKFADFDQMDTQTRQGLIQTVGVLNAAGISMKTSSTVALNLVKVFGQTGPEANKTAISLAALTKQLGQGSKAMEDLVSMTPKLAVFGSKGIEIFNETAIAAKKLGLETQELYGIVEKYDSFEKAAEAAGNFNLFLGGQFLDPIKLFKSSIEGDVIGTLRMVQDAMKQSGKDLNQLGPAFVKFGTDALKMDPKLFRQIFGQGAEGVELYIKQQEEASKRQENLNKIAENTQNIFTKIQVAFNKAFADPKLINGLVNAAKTISQIAITFAGLLQTVVKFAPLFAGLWAVGKLIAFGSQLAQLTQAMLLFATSTKAAAFAQSILNFLTNPVKALAVLALAGVGTAIVASLFMNYGAGGESGGGESQIPNAPAAGGGGDEVKPYAVTPQQDYEGKGEVLFKTGNTIRKTNSQDSVYMSATRPGGGGLADTMLDVVSEIKNLHGAIADLGSRPIVMNGPRFSAVVSEHQEHQRVYNPYRA